MALRPRVLAAAGRSDSVLLEGYDAGRVVPLGAPSGERDHVTVVANTSEGAWPLARLLDRLLGV